MSCQDRIWSVRHVCPHTQTCCSVYTWPMADDLRSFTILDTFWILHHPPETQKPPPLPWKGQDKGLTTSSVVTVILFASLLAIGPLYLVQAGQ